MMMVMVEINQSWVFIRNVTRERGVSQLHSVYLLLVVIIHGGKQSCVVRQQTIKLKSNNVSGSRNLPVIRS